MNRPLQARSGYNQGKQSMPLADSKFLGQPALKAGSGDTVIMRAGRVSPGENNIRVIGCSPTLVFGGVFNRTGGTIEYNLILEDDQGNEFLLNTLFPAVPITIDDGDEYPLYIVLNLPPSPLPLPEGWLIKFRLVSGDPSAGQGIIIWPWAHDMARNLITVVEPLTTSVLEIGPPEGRAWQPAGASFSALAGGDGQLKYLNFDSIPRTVVDEIFHLAGEDIKVNTGIVNINPRGTDVQSGVESAYQETENADEALVLAYPDTLKFRAGENQTSAPLYLVVTFAEFDLAKDLG